MINAIRWRTEVKASALRPQRRSQPFLVLQDVRTDRESPPQGYASALAWRAAEQILGRQAGMSGFAARALRWKTRSATACISLAFAACGTCSPSEPAPDLDPSAEQANRDDEGQGARGAAAAQGPAKKSISAPPDVAAPPAEADKHPSGLRSKVLRKGRGANPDASSRVTVHYTGWTTDGEMFDSSRVRGEPAEFSLGGVIEGWRVGLPLMAKGERRRFWIPEKLAYQGRPGAPQGMLVFDVELLDFQAGATPPQVPKNVKAPPPNAKRSSTGLAWLVLEKGNGERKPQAGSRVTVHYSGWTTDGEMFDSSVTRGQPATFPLNGVIAGWTEGVQLMVEGERRRFWIPEKLAYQGRPGAPQGMLVFDIELISIL